jgi:uncharacterized repeat protein (TIGR01451 family)
MKRLPVLIGLAVAAVCLAVWAGGIVVGQPTPRTPPAEVPKPTLSFDEPEPAPDKASRSLKVPAELPPAPAMPAMPAPASPAPAAPLPLVVTPPASAAVVPTSTAPAAPSAPAPVVPAPSFPAPTATSVGPDGPEGPGRGAEASNDNPTGRQEPAVSIEWVGPPTVKLGQPAAFQIVVKNVSQGTVQQAVVRQRIPAGVTVQGTEPKAVTDGDALVWDVGTLQPQQEKRLDLQLVAAAKGRCACQATVTFAGQSTVNLQVQEPKLVLKATAPDKVLIGDMANVMLTVTNPGDGTADHVKVKTALSEGLEHARGREVEYDLGNLGPNESRSVQVMCMTKAGGEQRCDASATSEGNLTSSDSAVFPVLQPKLELGVTGPRLRYLERQGIYTFKVTNPGDAPASNVSVVDQIPQGFKFVDATAGGRHDYTTRTVSWFVGDLAPHQSREVGLQVMAVNIGEYKHTAVARAARGLQADAEAETRVEGLSALLVELVDLDDPVEVGASERYEIRVTNTGSKTETDIQVVCTLPDKMEFWGAQGAGGLRHRVEGKEVVFETLPKLAPRADAIFRVTTRPTAPGDVRFKVRVKADSLTEPVNKEESTKVFGDEAPGQAPIQQTSAQQPSAH